MDQKQSHQPLFICSLSAASNLDILGDFVHNFVDNLTTKKGGHVQLWWCWGFAVSRVLKSGFPLSLSLIFRDTEVSVRADVSRDEASWMCCRFSCSLNAAAAAAPLTTECEAPLVPADRPWADVKGICPFWPRMGLSDPRRPRPPHTESSADVWHVCYLQAGADAPSPRPHAAADRKQRPSVNSELMWGCD